MFDLAKFYSKDNDPVRESYNHTITTIKDIILELDNIEEPKKEKYQAYLKAIAQKVIQFHKLEKDLLGDYFTQHTFEELLRDNNQFFEEILPENYEQSFTNPSYCVDVFGDGEGQLLSWFYSLYRYYIEHSFHHKIFKMEEYNQIFIKVYNYIKNHEIVDYDQLKELMLKIMLKDKTREIVYRFKEEYNPTFRYFQEIIEKDNLEDLRYLFKAGKFISDNEIKTARFLTSYPDKKLKELAQSIVKAYLKGFEKDNKTEFLKQKSTVGLHYKIGLEKLYRHMILEFKNYGLEVSILANRSTPANQQYSFDHQFDNSLYLTDNFLTLYLNSTKNGLEQNKEILSRYSGIMYIEKFGDPLFSPQKKKEVLKLSEDQQKLYQKWNAEHTQLMDIYTPRSETSFCIVSFPTPKIGDNFEKIFEETIKINMADSNQIEQIQQKMIDVLDLAESIHVRGKDPNQTNIIIKMQPLEDPSSQTNFLNSGASVNIPGGEIFTSPQLKGTNGILHVEETYQNSLRYDNLKLHFTDGYVTDYSCTNFTDGAENRRYIEENLLFPHTSLPLGEFAIGTNTLAYVFSRKYGILDVLPILISEKTGPHFAIGDTCYSREEDIVTFNQFNLKRICAKDNEKSRLRKTNEQEAYSYKHEDIVLAFDSIESISAIIGENNKVDIIKNGKFVLEGTEELNIPLNELESMK